MGQLAKTIPGGGVGNFSKEARSIFNKEKWLPLCRDTQFFISNICCRVMKKHPLDRYQKKNGLYPYIGTLADESKLREQQWVKNGKDIPAAQNRGQFLGINIGARYHF